MNNLKKSIMGKYNAEDVDKLLLKVRNDYEECLKEQKKRIFELREQNSEMTIVINEYRQKEKYIVSTIIKAEETAQSIIEQAELEVRTKQLRVVNEEKQIKVAIAGCYQKLYNLKIASESIFSAVSKAIGECEKIDIFPKESNVRQIKRIF